MFPKLLAQFSAGSRLAVVAVVLASSACGEPPQPTINCAAVDSALVIEEVPRPVGIPNNWDFLIHLPDFAGTFTSAQVSDAGNGAAATVDTSAPVNPSVVTVSVLPATPRSTGGTFRVTANVTDSVGTACPVDHVFHMTIVDGGVVVSK